MVSWIKKLHRKYGCKGCEHCIEKYLEKEACCGYGFELETGKNGKCLTRKDKS